MKAIVYAVLTTCALLLLVAATAMAQHPSDPNAVLIGTFETSIYIGGSGTTTSRTGVRSTSTSASDEGCQIKSTVQVWRTSTGAIEYVVVAESVQYIGECGSLGMTTSDIFAALAKAGLRKGIQLGYSPCNPDCQQKNYSRVYSALCVRRFGSGTSTRYESCSTTSYCYREYEFCCPNGSSSPEITEIPRSGDGCGSGVSSSCEPTCGGTSTTVIQ